MKPIVFFDLETTGVEITKDKAIQLAAIKVNPETFEEIGEPKNILFNPGIPIPAAASEVHGIFDHHVTLQPPFKAYAKAIAEYLDGCDYGGFNIKQFDVPLLAEEFAACGITWPAPDAKYLDALHVFREKEKRDLGSAVMFYCNEVHKDAHDALGDVRGTIAVVKGQMARYSDLSTLAAFGAFCENPNALDLAGKVLLNEQGVAIYGFGKDKGKTIKENPGYAQWMISKGGFATNTVNVLKGILYGKK